MEELIKTTKSKVIFEGYDKFIILEGRTLPAVKKKHIRTIDDPEYLTKVSYKEGVFFNETDSGVKSLLFDGLDCCSDAMRSIIIDIYVDALDGQKKVSTVSRWRGAIVHFFKSIGPLCNKPISQITLSMYNFYCLDKSANMQKNIRSVLVYWVKKTNSPGISEDLEHYLLYSSSPKTKSSQEIQRSKPNERPFSRGEIQNMLTAVESLYVDGGFNAQNYCMWKMIISEAMRPCQMRLLQIGDFKIKKDVVYGKVPIAKQHGMKARDYLFEVKYSRAVSGAIIKHLSFIKKINGKELKKSNPFYCFIYPNNSKFVSGKISDVPISIQHQLERTRKKILLFEHILDKDLELFFRRFKHTKLTDLAIRGASVEELARAGFQTSVISLKHYVNETEEMFRFYEAKMLDVHDMIDNAFRGEVVEKSHARKKDKDHQILTEDISDVLGSCGLDLCGVLAPVGCYICPEFQAFTDAPHKIVLDKLLRRRQYLIDNNFDDSVVSRDDRFIFAVKKVVNLIKKEKSE